MNPRERIEKAYALAFNPASLNELWSRIKHCKIKDTGETAILVDMALMLHQALPESGYSSQRALHRLAAYQARARAFGLPCFLRNIRKALGADKPIEPGVVPPAMVRDIALPELSHHAAIMPVHAIIRNTSAPEDQKVSREFYGNNPDRTAILPQQ